MTPKEKAKELVDKFRKEFNWVERDFPIDLYRDARQCALIAVDEMINTLNGLEDSVWYFNMNSFLQEVKQEIEKL